MVLVTNEATGNASVTVIVDSVSVQPKLFYVPVVAKLINKYQGCIVCCNN